MRFAPLPTLTERRPRHRGFTLPEVLASLMLIAVIVPVALQAMTIATRAGVLGQRKAAAVRVAERVLDEMIVTHAGVGGSAAGSTTERGATYDWTVEAELWSEDVMLELTARVTFTVQGDRHAIAVSTLVDPNAAEAYD